MLGPDLLLDMKTFFFFRSKELGRERNKSGRKEQRICDCVCACMRLSFEAGLLANSFVTHLGPLVFL